MISILFIALFFNASDSSNPPRTLEGEQLLPAMRKALASPAIQIEIVEVSHFPVPDGAIEFARKDLTAPSSPRTPARWRGSILSADGHRFSIWADVHLTASCHRVIAAEALPPDMPIRGSQLREESYEGFPSEACSWQAEEAVGLAPNRTIPANSPLSREFLVQPPAVHKGDDVIAEYRTAAVRLTLSVVAERNGRVGETIPVLNPSSHKVFQARVAGPGTVAVDK